MKNPNYKKFDILLLQKKISEILPKNRTRNIVQINEGFSTNIFKIVGEKIYYLRVPGSPKENLTPEYLIHKKLSKNKVKVPQIVYYENFCNELDGHSLMITSSIHGQSLLDTRYNKKIIYEAGIELAKINSFKFKGFGAISKFKRNTTKVSGLWKTHEGFLLRDFKEKLEKIYDAKIVTNSQINLIESFLENNKKLINIDSGNLAHGDFNLVHIFQSNNKYTGIIDFGDAKISNQLYDLAYFKICNRDLFEMLFDGYKSQIKLPNNHKEILKMMTIIVGVRIISSDLGDIEFINKKIFYNKKKSFMEEVRTLEKIRF
jgi:aminoglycoside phosphotransferase (APT) family kinase protein